MRWSSRHIPFPGAAFREMTELFIHQEALIAGKVPIGRRLVDLADIRVPVLSVTGARDKLVVPRLPAPRSRCRTPPWSVLELNAGHAGLIVGRKAHKEMIPAMLEWLRVHA